MASSDTSDIDTSDQKSYEPALERIPLTVEEKTARRVKRKTRRKAWRRAMAEKEEKAREAEREEEREKDRIAPWRILHRELRGAAAVDLMIEEEYRGSIIHDELIEYRSRAQERNRSYVRIRKTMNWKCGNTKY